MYKQQVKSILQAAKGRSDFIDWSGVRRVGNEVHKMLNIAGKHIENENYQSAVFICLAILEEMIEIINYTDDSNGDIGGTIETSLDLLGTIASVKLPENVRLYLLEQCQVLHKKKSFSGWGWDITLLHIAAQLVKSEKEADTIFSLLDNPDLSEFGREHVEEIKYELIRKMKGDQEADNFLTQYISNPELRRTAISKAIEDKNFEKAVSLANDGIKCDTEDKPGLALEWYDWLLRIALIQKDTAKIIEYARFLFVDGFRREKNYYSIMKKYVEPASWNEFVKGMAEDIKKNDRWLNLHALAGIYITEQWWEELLQLIAQNRSLNFISNYEKHLFDIYPEEISKLYEQGIIDFLKQFADRRHYQEACRYIRRMKKLGAEKQVNNLVEKLRKEYPQRRALMEELDLI